MAARRYRRDERRLTSVQLRHLRLVANLDGHLGMPGVLYGLEKRGLIRRQGPRMVLTPEGEAVLRSGRDLPESVGQHGYPAPRGQESEASRLRRIAERRRRYYQTTQYQGEQGAGYDQRRRRRKRRRR